MSLEFKRYSTGGDIAGSLSWLPLFFAPIPWDAKDEKNKRLVTQSEFYDTIGYENAYYVLKPAFRPYRRMGGVGGVWTSISFGSAWNSSEGVEIQASSPALKAWTEDVHWYNVSGFPSVSENYPNPGPIIQSGSASIRFIYYATVYSFPYDKSLNPQTGWTVGLKAYHYVVKETSGPTGYTRAVSSSGALTFDKTFTNEDNMVIQHQKSNPQGGAVPIYGPWLPLFNFSLGQSSSSEVHKYTGSARPPSADWPPPATPPPPLPPEDPPDAGGPWFCYKSEGPPGFYRS